MEFFAPAIALSSPDGNESIPLQRLDIPSERRPVHYHLFSQGIDGHCPRLLQLGKDRELRRAQARGQKIVVIKLRNLPRRLAQGRAIAPFGLQFAGGAHWAPSS